MTIDTTGSSPQLTGSINNPLVSTLADIGMVLRCLIDPTIPANDGTMRPVTTMIPEGSCLNPRPPAGVAGRGVLHTHFKDALWGAYAQMIPDKVRACVSGIDTGISIGGYYKDGTPYVFVDFKYCSWGGAPWGDGLDACCAPGANYSNHPVEVIEAQYPIMILQRGFTPDTGGPGKFRGGLAMIDDFLFLEEEATLQLRTDRHKFPPYGLNGGQTGMPSLNFLNPHGESTRLGKCVKRITKGDVLRTVLAGAAGWGDPLERDAEKVLDDVLNEKISPESAQEDYGVVIRYDEKGAPQVDGDATQKLRQGKPKKTKFVTRKPRKRVIKIDNDIIKDVRDPSLSNYTPPSE
jgi:N-methylhydantoinase B